MQDRHNCFTKHCISQKEMLCSEGKIEILTQISFTWTAVQQLGALIEHHVSGLHDDVVFVILVVQNQQRPVLVHVLYRARTQK